MCAISAAGAQNGSRSSTTRSASLPGFDPARDVVQVVHERRAGRVRGHGRCQAERLLGQEWLGFVACRPRQRPVDRDVHGTQRARAAHRPVAAGREPGAGARQVAEHVLTRCSLRAEERDGQLVHLRLVRGPQCLHVRRDVERGESRHVVGVDQPAGARCGAGGHCCRWPAWPPPRRPGTPAPPGRRWRGSAPGSRVRPAR